MDERESLIAGARTLGLTLTETEIAQLRRVLDELERWNQAYNLTSITARAAMLTHHLLDSLSIHGDVQGETVADVGTGAGFPGLPLAIVSPRRRFTLIDSNNKKIRFVAHATRALQLANVEPLCARAEAMRPAAAFDCVIARAFSPLPQLLATIAPLCDARTRVLAMKGRRPDEEIAAVRPPWSVLEARPLHVPGLEEARHLVVVEGRGL